MKSKEPLQFGTAKILPFLPFCHNTCKSMYSLTLKCINVSRCTSVIPSSHAKAPFFLWKHPSCASTELWSCVDTSIRKAPITLQHQGPHVTSIFVDLSVQQSLSQKRCELPKLQMRALSIISLLLTPEYPQQVFLTTSEGFFELV